MYGDCICWAGWLTSFLIIGSTSHDLTWLEYRHSIAEMFVWARTTARRRAARPTVSKNPQLLCSQSQICCEQRVTGSLHCWLNISKCVVILEAKRTRPPTMDVSTASPSAGNAVWPPAIGPNSLSGNQEMLHARFPPPPVHLGLHPRMGPAPQRLPIRPFFVREIYKNGFLKRLAPNEKKSSALSKLMRSDRYWVVFSVHDLGAEQVSWKIHFEGLWIRSRLWKNLSAEWKIFLII